MAEVTKFLSLAGLNTYNEQIKAYIAKKVEGHLLFQIVESLEAVTEPKDNVIYLIPNAGDPNNVKDEYMHIDGKWELIGTTAVSLEGYATEAWCNGKFETIANADLVRGRVAYLEAETARLESVKADKLDLDNYYDKDAIDGKVTEINNAAIDLSGRVSTAEATIGEHTTALGNVYTKTEVDNKLTEVNGAASTLEGRVAAVEGAVATKAEAADLEALEGVVGGKADKATTLEGYGITDAVTSEQYATLNGIVDTKAAASELEALQGTVNGMYTNAQLDTKLDGKMDDGDAYLKAETYTQAEVDGLVATAKAEAIASFTSISDAEILGLFGKTEA